MNEYAERNRERTGKRDRRLEPILAHYLQDTGIAAYDLSKYGFAAQLPQMQCLIWFGHVGTDVPAQVQQYLDQLNIMQIVYTGEDRVNWKIGGHCKQHHIGAIDKYFAQYTAPLAALVFDQAEPDIHMAWSRYLRNVGQSVYDLDMLILRNDQPALWVETKYIGACEAAYQFGWAEQQYKCKNIVIDYKLARDNFASLDDLDWVERMVHMYINGNSLSCIRGLQREQLVSRLQGC